MMYVPTTYGGQLAFMLISMICWGSWANTLNLSPGWPFQLFYWDYAAGILLASFGWGFALGGGPHAFWAALLSANATHIWLAIIGGIVFNAANLLLVAAIGLAGLAVAFPLGIGVALLLGVLLNYFLAPAANPVLLFAGVSLIVVALVVDALAYRRRDTERRQATTAGIAISVLAGVLMGLFYPFVERSLQGTHALGPYSVVPWFALGVIICTVPANFWVMRHPLAGQQRTTFSQYFRGESLWHLWGVLGGIIWCTGAVLNFVSSRGEFVGPAVAYAIGQGATMISAAWGVFLWHEFRGAPKGARRLVPVMFVFFLAGLGAIACAPVFR
jgi:glucose uptake protein